MDMYCKICGEPWDTYTLHDEIAERINAGALAQPPDHNDYQQGSPQYQKYREVYDGYYNAVRDEFYKNGCRAFYYFMGHSEPSWCQPRPTKTTDAMSALIDIMGNDLDGIASMMDDLEYMGQLD